MSAAAASGGVLAFVAAPFAFVLLLGTADPEPCESPFAAAVTASASSLPDGPLAGYSGDQLLNAVLIINAGAIIAGQSPDSDNTLTARDQTIAVMTAMGESSLHNIDYGDDAGPDSRGLFQQRDSWGSVDDRMDPVTAATLFYDRLLTVSDRADIPPTFAAHRVQNNADPLHYENYWTSAVTVVETLANLALDLGPDGFSITCGRPLSSGVGSDGWTIPAVGPITSAFGMRYHPTLYHWSLHTGTDLGAGGCDAPIWAAAAGTVTVAGIDSIGTGVITIDHGAGTTTTYRHSWQSGVLTSVGAQVSAGSHIARVGSSGRSTGCHLHFEIAVDGITVDPEPFLSERGISLG
jgi:hypothetical protein